MYTIERLIGVGCYVVFLAAAAGLLYWSKVDSRKILGGYLTVLAVMAFGFQPNQWADLSRIFVMMEEFAAQRFTTFLTGYVASSSTPVADLMYFVIGRTGVLHLMPMLSALVTYSSVFYILYRSAELFQVSRKNMAIALLFYMSIGNYIFVVSNIRTIMAISLLALCFFRESVEKEWNPVHLLLYAAAALIHNMAAILLVMRVVLPIFDRKIALWKRLLVILAGEIAGIALLVWKPELVGKILGKVIYYLTNDVYSHEWEYRIAALTGCVMVWLLWELRKAQPRYREALAGARTYLILCMVLAVCLIQVYTIFHRMLTYMAPILVLPIILIVLRRTSGEEKDYKRVLRIRGILAAASLVLLVLACTKGSLNGYKFFELP